MDYSLVIVDMQTGFVAANSRKTLKNCKREIRKAIKDDANIIFVEYNGCGRTIKELTEITDKIAYKKKFVAIKRKNSGAKIILKTMKKNNIPTTKHTNFRVCGVNTDACVLETVEDLARALRQRSYNIEVILSACNSSYSHKDGVSDLKNLAKDFNISL
jgi:nicotinamidase-related amidase